MGSRKGMRLSKEVDMREIYVFMALILLLVIFARIIFLLFIVPSESMLPTIPQYSIQIGVHLPYILSDPVPQRGDVIIFYPTGSGTLYLKRVIALPGETILIENGNVYIDGVLLEEPYVMPGAVTKVIGTFPISFVVPEDCLFVMGDNREDSYDSRFWLDPYVKISNIQAKSIAGNYHGYSES